MPSSTPTAGASHRYDLDWLRVVAFAILILYHVGMFYVTWGWHVKSPHAGPAAELPMMLVNAWRLALLFLISGVALRFATDKGGLGRFAARRSTQLLLPVVFGMLVVVAPQTYFELRQGGHIEAGYLAFYRQYLSFDIEVMRTWELIVPTWNHLWYVVYLLAYSWVVLLLIRPLRALSTRLERLPERGWPLVLLVPAVPFLVYRFALTPHFETTHNLVWDWANHANSLSVLLVGFLLAKNAGFWRAVARAWPVALALVVLCVGVFAHYWREPVFETLLERPAALAAIRALRILYAWWVIVAILGLAQRFANHRSALLRYMTQRVFAWYILHQTLTVTTGYYLARLALPASVEFALVLLATVGGSVAGAELIRPVPGLRRLFGMTIHVRARQPEVLGPINEARRGQFGDDLDVRPTRIRKIHLGAE
jgi:glucan biosynthesis protein C